MGNLTKIEFDGIYVTLRGSISNFKFFVLGTLFLSFLIISSSSCAKSESESTEANNAANEEITKQQEELQNKYTYDCVSKYNFREKYIAYADCIGSFTEQCNKNYDKFLDVFGISGLANSLLQCYDMEIDAWNELFEESSSDLRKNLKIKSEYEQKIDSLDDSLKFLSSLGYCSFEVGRWRKAKQASFDSLRCYRDNAAEKAIKVFLWNKHYKLWKNI